MFGPYVEPAVDVAPGAGQTADRRRERMSDSRAREPLVAERMARR